MKALSLHIGMNHLSPAGYGTDQPLAAAVNDSVAMQAIADSLGYQSARLNDAAATSGEVLKQIARAGRDLRAGDIFLLTYAGHGAQLFDAMGEEPDSLDETWCLFDRMVLDDELYAVFALFAAGVRILVISDSCHSGTVTRFLVDAAAADDPEPEIAYPDLGLVASRALPEEKARAAYLLRPEVYDAAKAVSSLVRGITPPSCIQLLAACQDSQLAADGDANGYFTQVLLHHWGGGAYLGSYDDFYARLKGSMPRRQIPNHSVEGTLNPAFLQARPFQP